jgi:hypothetical protein
MASPAARSTADGHDLHEAPCPLVILTPEKNFVFHEVAWAFEYFNRCYSFIEHTVAIMEFFKGSSTLPCRQPLLFVFSAKNFTFADCFKGTVAPKF